MKTKPLVVMPWPWFCALRKFRSALPRVFFLIKNYMYLLWCGSITLDFHVQTGLRILVVYWSFFSEVLGCLYVVSSGNLRSVLPPEVIHGRFSLITLVIWIVHLNCANFRRVWIFSSLPWSGLLYPEPSVVTFPLCVNDSHFRTALVICPCITCIWDDWQDHSFIDFQFCKFHPRHTDAVWQMLGTCHFLPAVDGGGGGGGGSAGSACLSGTGLKIYRSNSQIFKFAMCIMDCNPFKP